MFVLLSDMLSLLPSTLSYQIRATLLAAAYVVYGHVYYEFTSRILTTLVDKNVRWFRRTLYLFVVSTYVTSLGMGIFLLANSFVHPLLHYLVGIVSLLAATFVALCLQAYQQHQLHRWQVPTNTMALWLVIAFYMINSGLVATFALAEVYLVGFDRVFLPEHRLGMNIFSVQLFGWNSNCTQIATAQLNLQDDAHASGTVKLVRILFALSDWTFVFSFFAIFVWAFFTFRKFNQILINSIK